MSSQVFLRATPRKDRELTEEHKEVLCTDSNILPGLVTARGYYSLPRKSVEYLIDKKLFDDRLRSGTSWLGIPIYRPDGSHHGDIIRLFGSKSPTKYLWPSGVRQAADVHPIGREEWLTDLDVPIIITEGIRKSDALLSAAILEDIPCLVIALNGCWGWKARLERKASIALPDFQDIPLTGRMIYIVSDSDFRSNDEVRKGWTEAVMYFGSKAGKPTLSQLVIVPPKGLKKQGADDYLADGGTLADLLSLGSTPTYAMLSASDVTPRAVMYKTATQVISTAHKKVPHVLEPLIPDKGIVMVAGHSGTYKTWHCMSLVMDAAFGIPWTDHPEIKMQKTPVTSIYVNKEMGAQMMGTRLKQLAMSPRYQGHSEHDKAIGERIFIVGEGESEIDIADDKQRDRLEELIQNLQAKIVVLDSLSMSWSGDENDSAEVGNLYRILRAMTDRTGVCWIIVHHLLKPEQGRKRNLPDKFAVRGSGQLVQQADSVVLCSQYDPPEGVSDAKFTAISHSKGRATAELPSWITKFQDHDGFYVTLEYHGKLAEARAMSYAKSHGDPKKLAEWVAVALQEITAIQPTGSGMRTKELIRMLQVSWPSSKSSTPSESTLRRHLERMVEAGEMTVLDSNQRLGDLYKLPESIPEFDNIEEPEL